MTKNHLLTIFEKQKGELISGEYLAEQCGISRAAIWKAVTQLRQEGYDIEAIKKKGYRLNPYSDVLSLIKIQGLLQDPSYRLHIEKSVTSTNEVAKSLAITSNEEWIVVASEEQSEGKGKSKRQFHSPEGKGVYLSIVLRPNWTREEQASRLQILYDAVATGIEQVTGLETVVQDHYHILIHKQKVGGILAEGIVELGNGRLELLILGIGIYVHENRVGESTDLDYINCLSEIDGQYYNRSELIAAILQSLKRVYNS